MLDMINQYSGHNQNLAHMDLSSVGQSLVYCPSLKPWRVTSLYQCVRACVLVFTASSSLEISEECTLICYGHCTTGGHPISQASQFLQSLRAPWCFHEFCDEGTT